MSRPLDEFASPLKILHSTRDPNGDRRQLKIWIPESGASGMERTMREYTHYLSIHQFHMNCLLYGWELLAKHGMADPPTEFRLAIELEDELARQQATERIVNISRDLWLKARTPAQRDNAQSKIKETARTVSDPDISTDLLRIIGI